MKYRTRIYYTEEQKTLMWDRWQKGESLSSIARLFDRGHSSIEGILEQTGGIRPQPRRRSRLALTLSEREEISRGVVAGCSIRSIARGLGRAPSTVSRELQRNGGRLRYRANRADQAAWERARRPKICKLVQNRELAHSVALNLKKLWSPEQIAGWLKRTYPDHKDFQVSDETIYKSLFIQARGALKKELLQHLRRTRGMRRSRHHTQKTEDHGRIKDTVSIRERLGGGARRTRSWGRGPPDRIKAQSNRHPGRTSDALRDVGQSQQPRHRNGDQRLEQTSAQVTAGTVPVTDVGPGKGNGRSQTLQSRDEHKSLLLRSTKPLAARLKRKHQRTAPTILPERNGSLKRRPRQIECRGKTVKRTTQKNVRLRNASRTI